MQAAFVNDVAGATMEDLNGLREHFRGEFPEYQDVLDAAANTPEHVRCATLMHATNGVIGDVFSRHGKPYRSKTRDHRSLETQEDLALIKTQRALASMTDEKWEALAKKQNRNPVDLRRETWSRVFKSFRQHD